MSFFADMLAGGVAGFGKGLSDYASMQEREDEKRAMLEERMALQRQMQQEKLDNQLWMRSLSGKGGVGSSGSGGGGKGFNLVEMALNEQDPNRLDKLLQVISAVDKDGGASLANAIGRPLQETVTSQAPTTGDLARFDRGQQDSIPEAVTSTRNVDYDKKKGGVALQRMYTLFLDPSKTDDLAKAEGGYMRNDAATAEINQGMKSGMSLSEALDQSLPRLKEGYDPNRNDIQAQRIEETRARTQAITANGADNRRSRDRNAEVAQALKALQLAQAAEKEATSKNRADRQKATANAQARYEELVANAESEPAAPEPSAPGAFVYNPRKPSAAAAAYRNGK